MASLSRWAHFVPMTDALVGLRDREDVRVAQPVVLVNRQRIGKTRAHPVMAALSDEQPPAAPA
jgi:hypothetical protein